MYGLINLSGDMDKIEVSTMSIVANFDLGHFSESRAVTADAEGNIYLASWNGKVSKYDNSARLISSVEISEDLYDINIDDDRGIVVTNRYGQVHLLDTSLKLERTFEENNKGLFVSFSKPRSVVGVPDTDNDRVADRDDNCPSERNRDQADEDRNGIGDVCESDLLLDFVPTLVASLKTKFIPPEWGVNNLLCCSTSSARFSVTLENSTLASTRSSCSAQPTFAGFRQSTIGLKGFNSVLSSSGCGNLPINFNFSFEESKRYLFQMELNGGVPTVFVYSEEISLSAKQQNSEAKIEDIGNNLNLEQTIELYNEQTIETDNSFKLLEKTKGIFLNNLN